MRRIEIEPHEPPAAHWIAQAAAMLHEGAVAGYPTDTVYALGCAIDAKRSTEALYRIKKMDKSQRLAMLCPDLSTASIYGHFSQAAFRLAQRVFPGPYTLVVPASREVPKVLLDRRRRSVGIRISAHPVTRALVQKLGRPLLTTSAFTVEGEPCRVADDVEEAYGQNLDLLVDSGPVAGGLSTVLSVMGEDIEVIREGIGPIDDLLG